MIDALLGATDLCDEDGRPLGEAASTLYEPRETPCPYAGSRRGLPMNTGALKQVSACWPDVLATARWLAGTEATVYRAWRATCAGLCAAPVAGPPVPRVLSALYKTCLGFNQVLTFALLSDDLREVPLAELGDASVFLAWMERDRWLVGNVQACAGPPAMIGGFFDALAHGDGRAEAPAPWPAITPEDCAAAVRRLVAAAVDPAHPLHARVDAARPAWLHAIRAVPLGDQHLDRLDPPA